MNKEELFQTLKGYGVVPVIAIDSVASAIPLADALIAGGLPVAEVTFRTAAAAEVMVKLRKERPQLLLGAGTVLSLENLSGRWRRAPPSAWRRGPTRRSWPRPTASGCPSSPGW